jgi:hypothetical protein
MHLPEYKSRCLSFLNQDEAYERILKEEVKSQGYLDPAQMHRTRTLWKGGGGRSGGTELLIGGKAAVHVIYTQLLLNERKDK